MVAAIAVLGLLLGVLLMLAGRGMRRRRGLGGARRFRWITSRSPPAATG